ncbi:MAG: ATP-binding protein [Chromatiales bacterium]|nr:ATP-binding protein [Chromatiales bacterium]
MPNNEAATSLMGADILNLITTGMYHTPLAVYREYIQNAADAIKGSPKRDEGRVEISIDAGQRKVTIRDNGPGLTHAQAKRDLIPIAHSRKRRGVDRGFRGIGRLSGLAFAEAVTFRTRSRATQAVTEIRWDGATLRASVIGGEDPREIIEKCVNVSKAEEGGWPDHFFEVEIEQVARHAANRILNRDAVRRYIGEVGPVPMCEEFPFREEIEALFEDRHQPLTLEVTINAEEEPVRRRHGAALKFSEERTGAFVELEPVRVPAPDCAKDAAIGWIAHSSYLGAIPKDLGIRGIRLREGNIQIGDENALDTLFREERFNRWCVGEIHVVDARLLPNGRRDYFEPGPHMRQIENHLESIIQSVVHRCRNASAVRNQQRKVQTTLDHMDSAYELAGSGYLKAADAKTLIEKMMEKVQTLEESLDPTDPDHENKATEIERLRAKLSQFRPKRGRPPMGKVRKAEIATYQRVFKALTELCPSPSVAKEMIEGVLGRA